MNSFMAFMILESQNGNNYYLLYHLLATAARSDARLAQIMQ
jgi:hypothetical protein